MKIEWTRVAKPQEDGYDLTVLAHLEPRWQKRPRDFHEFCDGHVSYIVDPNNEQNRADDTLVQIGSWDWPLEQTSYLRQWPAGYRALCGFLDEFRAFRTEYGGCGCSSGHQGATDTDPAHCVYVSVNDLNGCAQGIYHEMAHLRLESLGMHIEGHDSRLILNGSDELFNSSVRFDKQRPMSAVIHGTYAWLMFTQNDYQNRLAGKLDLSQFKQYAFHNLPKIQKGVDEIKKHVRSTPEGADFLAGLYAWADDLLTNCERLGGSRV